jgi:uncharacterized oxidoreductase
MIIREEDLKKVVREILMKAGSDEMESEIVAEHLVRANLLGIDSHGVGMLPQYIQNISKGLLKPNTPAKLIKEDGSILIFDGQRGFGQRIASEAMNAAIAKCKDTGLAVMALRNTHHIGRIGAYGEQSIKDGIVSLHFVNVVDHNPVVAPYGGRDSRFITNPVCMAMPGTKNTEPVLLDMATSKIPVGKARVAINSGKELPDDMVIDKDGNPTNDPGVIFSDPPGSLLAFGLHKGYGIAIFCELLAGVLGGGGTIQPENDRLNSVVNNMLVFLVDPNRLVNIEWMHHEIDAFIAYVKASPPFDLENPVMIAGDPERKIMGIRKAKGIPMPPEDWERILVVGETVGIKRKNFESYCSSD